MGKMFHPNRRIGDSDIDSDFIPAPISGHSIMSMEDDESIIEEEFYSSNSGIHGPEIYDRTNSSDSDSIEYYSDDDERDEEPPGNYAIDKSSYTSTTGESERGSKQPVSEKSLESAKKKKKKGFFGKLKGGVKKLVDVTNLNKPKQKKRNSDLSDGDIERSEEYGPSSNGRSSENYHPLDGSSGDSSYDVSIEEEEESHYYSVSQTDSYSESYSNSRSGSNSAYYPGDLQEDSSSSAQDPPMMSPISRRNSDRRKNYERHLPEVVEEEEEPQEDYKTYKLPLPVDPAEHSDGRIKKDADNKENVFNIRGKGNPRRSPDAPEQITRDAPEETPDPPTPKAKKSKGNQSPKTTKSKKKKRNSHSSTLSGRTHTVSSRIDWAGQINSPKPQKKKLLKVETEKLNAEIHRLRTLVDLMMTRMELYERQSECLVETSLEHDQEWKTATIKQLEEASKKHDRMQSQTEQQLSNIKNLLMERSVQDKWIRQLETVQRGYQQRLNTTHNQLRALRYEHVLTNKRIVDMKKGSLNMDSAHTPETSIEDFTKSTKTDKAIDEALTPLTNNLRHVDVPSDNPLDNTSGAVFKQADCKAPENTGSSLLEEMIVSWQNDATDISVLSERGMSKKKKKDKKKKKKDKKSKSGSTRGSVASSVVTSEARSSINQDPQGGLLIKV